MLGKLLKHEIIATWKIFVLLDVITILAGGVVGIFGYNFPNLDRVPEPLAVLLGLGFAGYFVLLVASGLLTLVFIVVRYYRNLYTAQGYLTFTLPATTTEILSSKIIVSFVAELLNFLSIGLSVGLVGLGFAALGMKESPVDTIQILEGFRELWYELFGIDSIGTTCLYIAYILISVLYRIIIFFFAISLGQLWQQHKVLGSVIFYFVINAILSVVHTLLNIGSGSFSLLFMTTYDTSSQFFTRLITTNTIISLIAVIGMYIGSILITDRKLNLD